MIRNTKWTVRGGLVAVAIALVGLAAVGGRAANAAPAEPSAGQCARCSCPGFRGSGWACIRGGCGHHYDLHR